MFKQSRLRLKFLRCLVLRMQGLRQDRYLVWHILLMTLTIIYIIEKIIRRQWNLSWINQAWWAKSRPNPGFLIRSEMFPLNYSRTQTFFKTRTNSTSSNSPSTTTAQIRLKSISSTPPPTFILSIWSRMWRGSLFSN